ncbi:MAG: thiol-disulfide oxidoreductase DCC family protein [Sphingobacteriaceae bacterium]
MSEKQTVVFFDGACPMCVGVSGWLSRIDGKNQFKLIPYQNTEMLAKYPQLSPEACAKKLHLVSTKGQILSGADAILEIWKQSGHWSSFLANVFLLLPFIWLARLTYRLIARNRQFFS